MDKTDEILTRGVEKIYPSKEALEKALRSGKKIKLYLGIDPSNPDLHLGHTIVLRKLREFQDLGHEVILLIGDFTGRIGDPTDKTSLRKKLTHSQVLENAKTYQKQASKILSFDEEGKNPVKVKYNSEWLDKLTFNEVIELASCFTVQQFIERDMFKQRIKQGKSIGLNEFLYPLMQAYDSVCLKIDLEVGGNDQIFNMLVGRDLVKTKLNKEKYVLAVPLLLGTDGQKMGKSLNNYISLTSSPSEMYNKIMSIKDELIINYFELCTDLSVEKIKQHQEAIQSNKVNPMTLKKELALEIVKNYHSEQDAKKAQKEFENVGQDKKMPSNIPDALGKTPAGEYNVKDFLVSSFAGNVTASEVKRMVGSGTVEIDGKRYTDPQEKIDIKGGEVVKHGKILKGKIFRVIN